MGLHGRIDTVAVASSGVWSKTYHAAGLKNRCNLLASLGLMEIAPTGFFVLTTYGRTFVALARHLGFEARAIDFNFRALLRIFSFGKGKGPAEKFPLGEGTAGLGEGPLGGES